MEQEKQTIEETPVGEESAPPYSTGEGSTIDPNDKDALIALLTQDLEAERAKISEMDDRLKRTIADSMNLRKRLEKQLADSIDRASAHIIGRLLPVLDDLDLAFHNLPDGQAEDAAAWINGFRQIQKKLEMVLEEQNVTKFVDTGILDPTRHEAIMSEPHEEIESGHIIETVRPGYEQKGRILRAALVKVAM